MEGVVAANADDLHADAKYEGKFVYVLPAYTNWFLKGGEKCAADSSDCNTKGCLRGVVYAGIPSEKPVGKCPRRLASFQSPIGISVSFVCFSEHMFHDGKGTGRQFSFPKKPLYISGVTSPYVLYGPTAVFAKCKAYLPIGVEL